MSLTGKINNNWQIISWHIFLLLALLSFCCFIWWTFDHFIFKLSVSLWRFFQFILRCLPSEHSRNSHLLSHVNPRPTKFRGRQTCMLGIDISEALYHLGIRATLVIAIGHAFWCVNTCLNFWKHLGLSARNYPTWLQGDACLNAPLAINERSKQFPLWKACQALFTSVHQCH